MRIIIVLTQLYTIINVKLLRVQVKDLLLTYLKREKFVKDIIWENGKAFITLLYDEEDAFRSHRVVLKNLIREVFAEHNTACKFMESKTLELI